MCRFFADAQNDIAFQNSAADWLKTGAEVLFDHEGHLEGDGVVKFPQVQPGELLDLLQAVHQGIAVDEELTGGFGNIQVVLKELVDGEQSFLIQGVNGVALEDLGKEYLTQKNINWS